MVQSVGDGDADDDGFVIEDDGDDDDGGDAFDDDMLDAKWAPRRPGSATQCRTSSDHAATAVETSLKAALAELLDDDDDRDGDNRGSSLHYTVQPVVRPDHAQLPPQTSLAPGPPRYLKADGGEGYAGPRILSNCLLHRTASSEEGQLLASHATAVAATTTASYDWHSRSKRSSSRRQSPSPDSRLLRQPGQPAASAGGSVTASTASTENVEAFMAKHTMAAVRERPPPPAGSVLHRLRRQSAQAAVRITALTPAIGAFPAVPVPVSTAQRRLQSASNSAAGSRGRRGEVMKKSTTDIDKLQ